MLTAVTDFFSGAVAEDTCESISTSRIPDNFWHDMSWLNTPVERHANLIPPAIQPGGLLGGSTAAPKMSKLQALAAARKKKAAEQKATTTEDVEKPMSNLAINSYDGEGDGPLEVVRPISAKRVYPPQKRKDSEPHAKTSPPPEPAEMVVSEPVKAQRALPDVETAPPSAFANTMFSRTASKAHSTVFTMPYSTSKSILETSTDAFSGPSPDDVVMAAQSKGVKMTSQKK